MVDPSKYRTWPKEMRDWWLGICEQLYRKGEKHALMFALAFCAVAGGEMPIWVRDVLFRSNFESRPKSWDDLFGPPVPKGKSVAAWNRRKRIEMFVIGRTRQLHAQGEPIDDSLFERVGKEARASGSTAKNIYYNKGAQSEFDDNAWSDTVCSLMRRAIGDNPSDDTMAAWLKDNATWIKGNAPRKRISKKLS